MWTLFPIVFNLLGQGQANQEAQYQQQVQAYNNQQYSNYLASQSNKSKDFGILIFVVVCIVLLVIVIKSGK